MRSSFIAMLSVVLLACDTFSDETLVPPAGSAQKPGTPKAIPVALPKQPALCPGNHSEAPGLDKLDLLFVIDNSNSMQEEQASLREQFPRMMQVLTSGMRSADDPAPFAPITDLHVGVISSDMGTAGVNFGTGTGCGAQGGDDGRLLSDGHGDDCQTHYPQFLSYSTAGDPDADALARDFGCIANLGTKGCGFEQQLEAALKALWPSQIVDSRGNAVMNPIRFLSFDELGTLGHGDVPAAQGGNLGFLRNDPSTGLSLLAIVVVTDEDDGSVSSTEHLKPNNQLDPSSPFFNQDLNLRNFLNPEFLFSINERYLQGFKQLRPGNTQLVVFAAIAGVPPDLVDADARSRINLGDARERDAFYSGILDDPRMQERAGPGSGQGLGTGALMPSCVRTDSRGGQAVAFPPRRLVELARGFGSNGVVQSICQDDFAGAIDAIVEVIARRIEAPCAE